VKHLNPVQTLTPWNRVLLENPVVANLVKKLSAFSLLSNEYRGLFLVVKVAGP
jgi:hypothetical protein